MSKAVGTIVKGIAAVGLIVAGAVTGNVALIAAGVSLGLSTAVEALQKAPVTNAQTQRLTANIDPQAKRKTTLGSTAFPVDVRYQEWFGTDQQSCGWIVALGSHAIESLDQIWLDDELAWSSSGGTQGKYVGYFWLRNLVKEGTPLNTVTVSSAGKWNSSHRLTGCAYAHIEFKVTGNSKKAESPFSSGIPTRITMIGKGAKLYDPRRDSTVTGGSGPMRADDQSTWRFITDDAVTIGDNLALQILRVKLGWRIKNPVTGTWKLATGMGLPKKRIDLESYITAANLCDEATAKAAGGTEPRFSGAAVISEEDDPMTSINMLCAGCCGRITDRGGRLGLSIAHNDLAATATDEGLNDTDVLGAFTWDPDPSLEATPNVVRGRYTDPSPNSLYQMLDYPEIRIASIDGQDRPLPLDLSVVESPSQAQRVAAQALMRKQYERIFQAPFDIRAWKYRIGDPLPFTFGPLSFNRTLFRVVDQQYGKGGVCNMTLRLEDAAIYPAGGADAPAVSAAAPTVYDSRNNPLILAVGEAADDASAALAELEKLADDGVLTIDEKIRKLIPLSTQLASQYDLLDDQAADLSAFSAVVAARAIATSAYSAWTTYRDGLSPAWNNITIDTFVTRSTFNGKIDDLTYALKALEVAIRAAVPEGASSFNLVNVDNCTFPTPDSIKKTSPTGWDSRAYATPASPVAFVTWVVPSGAQNTMGALTTDPLDITTGNPAQYYQLDYALFATSTGVLQRFRNGVPLTLSATRSAGDRFTILCDGRYVRYFKNGVELLDARHAPNAPNEALYPAFALYELNSQVTGIACSAAGAAGADGSDGLTGFLTNETHTLPATTAGVVTSYSGATGNFKVFSGAGDVTANFTFSIASNPQGLTDPTGINAATGAYSISGGFDAAEPTASITFRATGTGAFAGKTLDKTFSLSKSPTGAPGSNGDDAKIIKLNVSPQTFRYDKSGAIVAQTITWTVSRQNTSAPVTWRALDKNGTDLTGALSATALAATGFWTRINDDTVTMSHTQFAALIAGAPARETLTLVIEATDVVPLSDKQSIAKVADGVDAVTASISPAAISVPCTAGGTPKGALPGAQITAYKGNTNITTTAGYTFTSSGVSGPAVSSSGAVSVTGMSADKGWVEVTVTDGSSAKVRVTYDKVLDGANFVDGNQSIGAPASTSFATVATLSLLMGPNGTLNIDANGGFDVGSGTTNVAGTIDYSLNGGSSWTTGPSLVCNAATISTSGDFSGSAGLSGATIGLATKQTVMVRVTMRKTNTTAFSSFSGVLHVDWSG